MQNTIREHRDNGQAGGIFNRYNILNIQKVRNKKLWDRYEHRRKEVADENHNHDNERMLFHGMCKDFFFMWEKSVTSTGTFGMENGIAIIAYVKFKKE